jgi:chemotaxis protein MotA
VDITSLVGFLLAIALILGSIAMGNAPFSAFIDIPSIAVVIGGAGAAGMMAFPLKSFMALPMVMKKAFLNKPDDLLVLIQTLVSLAEVARRDGLLALESKMADVSQPVIKSGLQMAIDGNDADTIESVMRTEMEAIFKRHKEGRSILDQLARFAPAYGMIGTLMGLIMMLSDMSDPSGIGKGCFDHHVVRCDCGQRRFPTVCRKAGIDQQVRTQRDGIGRPRCTGHPIGRESTGARTTPVDLLAPQKAT